MMDYYDPVELAREIEKVVVKGNLRKYYRLSRSSRWYGGIAEAHCCGCCLKCVFCWSGFPRDHPEAIGDFYPPEKIFEELSKSARRRGLRLLRITGNEPTLGWNHLIKILELVDETDLVFILETNGILIGKYPKLALQLSNFKNLHVRVSLKGTSREEFAMLTGATPESFDLQLKALEHLQEAGVEFNPAVMLSFSNPDSYRKLKLKLREIHKSLPANIEEEYVILYPPVVDRLKKVKIKPKIAFKLTRTHSSNHY
ncbi:MAG: radical SAM protein [Thermoproteota archaeon]